MKLFISYRSLDSDKVDTIVAGLTSLKNPDGTPRYTAWQDKYGIPPGKDWWEAIVDAIIDCQIFMFHISAEALKSDVCRAELQYARERNRYIIPVVLPGEFTINPSTIKAEIPYWDQIPDTLNDFRTQFLFHKGAAFFSDFEQSIAAYDPKSYRDINRPRPADPRAGSAAVHDGITLYNEACDYAGRMEFATARKLFQKLMHRNDPDFYSEAVEWIELLGQYEHLLAMDARTASRYKVPSLWIAYQKLFPKPFWDGIFDPKDFKARFGLTINQTATPERDAKKEASGKASAETLANIADDMTGYFTKKRSGPQLSSPGLIRQPFEWIDIPEGKVTLQEGGYILTRQTFDVSAFSIAKYPITNAQYAQFIEADGYHERRWWTAAGWDARNKENWLEPRFWQDKDWNLPEYPVVGVTWYECIAFCLWLGHRTNEIIMLPTEQQWQRAAQGDVSLKYPWGNEWDASRCNNRETGPQRMTAVRQYEGKGDSPYGVVDMAGNTLEWSVTSYQDGTSNINKDAKYRVLRGGSWLSINPVNFRSDDRLWYDPSYTNNYTGFRLARF